MNEEQYKALCDACDHLLLEDGSSIERIAIPWLHVIREHPVMLSNYSGIFADDEAIRFNFRDSLSKFHDLLRWFKHLVGSCLKNNNPWYGPEKVSRDIDVLFVSHLLNPSLAGKDDDFYFGHLPKELSKNGYSVAVVLINHSGGDAKQLATKWDCNPVKRYVFSSHLGAAEEYSLHNLLNKESMKLKTLAKNSHTVLLKRILSRASREALSFNSLFTLRIHSQMFSLVSKLRPKAVVTTLEGHAWERLVFAASRSARPGVHCIGYQHAALFRLQHAIRRPLADEYNPDCIFTAGKVSEAQLKHSQELKGIPISVLGSNRIYRPAMTKVKRQNRPVSPTGPENHTCLVIPEGIEGECDVLFDFSIKSAHAYPDILFIWRLHPVVNWKSLRKRNSNLRHLPQNIILSESTLNDDLERCDCALYRGTTAIVQAVMAGLRPIYLELENELTIDPLYELDTWRVKIKNVIDFGNLFNETSGTINERLKSDKQSAIDYCADFYCVPDFRPLESVIH